MTRSSLTHLYFLLDRSGSMQSIKTDTEGGFAAFIDVQSAGDGECVATLAQFDDGYDVVYRDVAVDDVPALSLQPRGSTALLDAIGRLVTDAGSRLAALPDAERPGTVIAAIMTDGHENSSREWTHPAIKALTDQQATAYGWEFLYMGADQDAIEVGASIGIRADNAVSYSRGKTREAMAASASKVGELRKSRMVDPGATMPRFTSKERLDLS